MLSHALANELIKMAAANVGAFADEDLSDSGLDAYYAAAQVLAELLTFVRNNDEAGLVYWLNLPPTQWYSVDGDPRWEHPLFAKTVQEWDES